MNNKGFSLIELLITISLIALVAIIVVKVSGNTLSLTENEAYKILKNNVINTTDKYIIECESNILKCSYTWNDNKTSINADELIKAGYFDNIIDPRNDKDISNCLIIEIEKENEVNKYKINDKNCK